MFGPYLAKKLKNFNNNFFGKLLQKNQEISGISFMPENIITDYKTGNTKKIVSSHSGG